MRGIVPAALHADDSRAPLLSYVHPPGWANPAPAPLYDLVVLGGGTAGLVCAAGAAGLGARVALVERALLGGDCLHTGCVPSKALLRAARAVLEARNGAAVGVRGSTEVDFTAVMARVAAARLALAPNDAAQRLSSLGVDVFFGSGAFEGPRSIAVDGRVLNFRRAVIATGSHPHQPPTTDHRPPTTNQLTTDTVFDLTTLPPRLLIVGAGPSGCELAEAFALLGSSVTLTDVRPRILQAEDPDAAAMVARALERCGVSLALGGVAPADPGGTVLLATGRRPSTNGLTLEAAGVHVGDAGVIVDDHLRTANRRVFAAGDVCSRHHFTHAADATARIVVANALFFGRQRVSALVIPRCIYTQPELAAVGERTGEVITVPLEDVDRAVLESAGEGFLRIWHSRGRIRGAVIVAPHAGETIGTVVAVMRRGGTLSDLANTVFPYPTASAALKRAGDTYRRGLLTPWRQRILRAYFAALRR